MEAVAEPVAEVAAEVGEPGRGAVEVGGVATFGHEQDAVPGDGETDLQGLDFRQVGGVGDDEFEPGFGRVGEKREGVADEAEGFGHAGVGKFRGDVELIDGGGEFRRWDAGGVGFHLEYALVPFGADVADRFEKFRLLEQGFSTGDDHPGAWEIEDDACGLGRIEFDGDLGFAVFGVAGKGVLLVWPRRALEVPGVVGIAPDAMEVATRRADEDRG